MSTKKDKFSIKDKIFMELALKLAKARHGLTGINPSVGCLVCKSDKILSYGVTGIGGSPHAEYSALVNLKKNNNLDCYVSLEPCHHQGKNPPCTKSIVNKNVKNLYYSETDNDSRVQGKGLEFLQNNKIKINKINNLFKSSFYKSYNDFNKNYLPKVYAKIATTKNYYSFIKKLLLIAVEILFTLYIVNTINNVLHRNYEGDFVTASFDYYIDNSNFYLDFGNTGDSLKVAGDVVAFVSSDKRSLLTSSLHIS